jgi:hypothetical protein
MGYCCVSRSTGLVAFRVIGSIVAKKFCATAMRPFTLPQEASEATSESVMNISYIVFQANYERRLKSISLASSPALLSSPENLECLDRNSYEIPLDWRSHELLGLAVSSSFITTSSDESGCLAGPARSTSKKARRCCYGRGVTGSEAASLGDEVLIIVASGSTGYRKYREIMIQGQISKAFVGSEGIRTSDAHQLLVGRAIRTWPKIEMDELVFCLPEKKWMSIYAHRAYLAA